MTPKHVMYCFALFYRNMITVEITCIKMYHVPLLYINDKDCQFRKTSASNDLLHYYKGRTFHVNRTTCTCIGNDKTNNLLIVITVFFH